MRVVLLTDSLGCPRENMKTEDIWTDKILSEFSLKGIVFYTCCYFGLSVKDIPKEYIGYLNPDLVICQVGIVDACRRALSEKEEKRFSAMPHVGKVIRSFCSRKHYFLTKIRNIHRTDEREFSKALDNLIRLVNGKIVFIEIAPPGEYLTDKTYNVNSDVIRYNEIIESKRKTGRVDMVKPFSNYGTENRQNYLLPDGHHLNTFGHNMVYANVSNYLTMFMSKTREMNSTLA